MIKLIGLKNVIGLLNIKLKMEIKDNIV